MSLKLLDYRTESQFSGIFGRPRHIAWPVDAFRITLPKTSNQSSDRLNPFERVIFKVLDASSGGGVTAVAQETCIPEDLVQSVLLRLRDKNLIDADNRVVDAQRRAWANAQESHNYATALVFRELVGGSLLPFLYLLDDNQPLMLKKDNEQSYRIMHRADDFKRPITPLPRDIISIINQMKKRSEAYAKSSRTPALEQIRVEGSPEQFFLDCLIAIQKRDGEFRITDPFGYGYSRVLESAFTHRLEEDQRLFDWLMKWRENLSNPSKHNGSEVEREPYDNEKCLQRYPELVSNLRIGKFTSYRSIEKIYAALEWALFYSCNMRPSDAAVRELQSTNGTDYSDSITNAARHIGFDAPPTGFRPLMEGKIDDFFNGKPEMDTVLTIALLMARDDEDHPLNKLADECPNMIFRIREITGKRGERAHGKGAAQGLDAELPDDPFMRRIVNTLLPDVRFADTRQSASNIDTVLDARFDARTSLLGEFEYKLLNRIGANTQERLIDAELFWLSCKDDDDALSFVGDLYAALQSVFRDRLSGATPPDITDAEYISFAESAAKQSGLGELPASTRLVQAFRIRDTLQGNDLTLGACVVAFLLVSDEETLSQVMEYQPSFIKDVVDIVDPRGHHTHSIPMSRDAVGRLRKSAYSTIRTLLEA